jgi:hypothetical protein
MKGFHEIGLDELLKPESLLGSRTLTSLTISLFFPMGLQTVVTGEHVDLNVLWVSVADCM